MPDSPSSAPRGGGRGVFPRLPWNTWLFGSLAVLVGGWSTWTAATQQPRPDPFRPPSVAEALRYPLQRNGFARNPIIRGHLGAVFAVPGTRTVWAGGADGLLLRSDDSGVGWTRVSLPSALTARNGATPASAPVPMPTVDSAASPTTALRPGDRPRFVGASILPTSLLFRAGAPRQQDPESVPAPRQERLGKWLTPTGGVVCHGPVIAGQAACEEEDIVSQPQSTQGATQRPPPPGYTPVPANAQAVPPASAQGPAPDSSGGGGGVSIGSFDAQEAVPVDTLDDVSSIFFLDAERGWVTLYSGVVLETRNGGQRWERSPAPKASALGTPYGLFGVRFIHRDTGWVAGGSAVLRYTRQSGWWMAAFPTNTTSGEGSADLVQMEPVDAVTAYAISDAMDGPELWVTRDGGASWDTLAGPPPSTATRYWYPRSIHFTAPDRGWLLMDREDGTEIFLVPSAGARWGRPIARIPTPEVIRFAGRLRGVMVESGGRILYTADGGASWRPAEGGAFQGIRELALDPDGQGWAVGDYGLVLTTADGGRRWSVRAGGGDQLRAGAFAGAAGWVVGSRGTLLATRDSGRTWKPRRSGTDATLSSIHLSPDGRVGWAVGAAGTAVHMRDGQTWASAELAPGYQQRLGERHAVDLTAVHFTDPEHGWIVGLDGLLLATANGGRTWDTLPEHPLFSAHAIYFRSPRQGWLAGERGVHRTENGGRTWIAPDSAPEAWALSLYFLNDSVGWASGVNGAILSTRNGGRTWTAQRTPTRAVLTSVRFADPRNGWAAGWNGTLLATRDGGATWQAETSGVGTDLSGLAQTPAGEPWAFGQGGLLMRRTGEGEWLRVAPLGRRWPGAWYLAALSLTALFGLMAVPARRPPVEPDPVDGILLSDRPLQPGDPDPLDLNRLARGISRFLRNEGTEPPLTIAITGGWGSGKSSLMNLVRSDLARRGWRPVWFNAWHHQTEAHLLASLLENVRAQAVPPWLSLRGIVFRARLVLVRIRRNKAGVGAAAAAAVLYAGYLTADPSRVARVREAITAAPEAPSGGLALLERVGALLFPGDPSVAVLVYGALGAVVVMGRALRAFGVNPVKLLATASQAVRLRELEEKPGFRHRFAVNFQEVTRALRPLDLVIFIDDLDRCRPGNVMTILESVNFLVSSGECVVIMGMDAPRVIHSVAMELKGEAGGEDPHAFARRYLEKLINIDVHVPTPEEGKLGLLLFPAPPVPEPSRRAAVAREAVRGARVMAPVLATAAVLATVFLLGRWMSPPLPQASTGPAAATEAAAPASGPSTLPPAPAPHARPVADAPDEAVFSLPARGGEVFTLPEAADNDWLLGLGLALTIAVVAWRTANRPEATTRDSDAFSRARAAWMRYVASMRPTPRGSKKFMNRLRFYIMRQGAAAAPDTLRERLVEWMLHRPRLGAVLRAHGVKRPEYGSAPEHALPEGVLVGLVSVQEFQPDVLGNTQFYRQFRARMSILSGVPEETLEGMGYPASLSEADRALFSALVEGVRIS